MEVLKYSLIWYHQITKGHRIEFACMWLQRNRGEEVQPEKGTPENCKCPRAPPPDMNDGARSFLPYMEARTEAGEIVWAKTYVPQLKGTDKKILEKIRAQLFQ